MESLWRSFSKNFFALWEYKGIEDMKLLIDPIAKDFFTLGNSVFFPLARPNSASSKDV